MKVIASHPNYELRYEVETGILLMKFLGDIPEDIYKGFWNKSIDFASEKRVNRIIIDQQGIGNVSFMARGWVVLNAFPRVKKELPGELAASVISSKRIMQKTGMQYLLKAFVSLTGYKVELHPTAEEAMAFLEMANRRPAVYA